MFKYLKWLGFSMGILSRLSVAAADHKITIEEILDLLRSALTDSGIENQVVIKSGQSEKIVSTVKTLAEKVGEALQDKECTMSELLETADVVIDEMNLKSLVAFNTN